MFDEQHLTNVLLKLPITGRIAFAASCCERLLPNYQAFVVLEKWGDHRILEEICSSIWSHLTTAPLSKDQIELSYRAAEGVTPDENDFPSMYAALALKASSAICYALNCCKDGGATWATLAARMAFETIDLYLFTVNTPFTSLRQTNMSLEERTRHDRAFDVWIEQAPLLVDELQQQQRDLLIISQAAEIDEDLLRKMRLSSSNMGLQLTARGIVNPEFNHKHRTE